MASDLALPALYPYSLNILPLPEEPSLFLTAHSHPAKGVCAPTHLPINLPAAGSIHADLRHHKLDCSEKPESGIYGHVRIHLSLASETTGPLMELITRWEQIHIETISQASGGLFHLAAQAIPVWTREKEEGCTIRQAPLG